MIPAEKPCSRCKAVKPADDFYPRPNTKIGLSSQCRQCNRDRANKWQRDNREQANANKRRSSQKNPGRAQSWAEANRERSRAIKAKWRLRNPDKVRQINQSYYIKNADKVKESAKSWRERNPERWALIIKLNKHRREARLRAVPTYTVIAKDARRLLSSPCAVPGCGATDIQIDHIIPIARGGSHGIGNLQPLCGSHNASKHDKTWMEFRLYLRRTITCEVRTA